MNSIAVIDDELGILDILRDILEDENYKVFIASDGLEGMNILDENPIDLVFLDIWLPGKGGVQLLEEIKKKWPEIEVVIISGHVTVEVVVKTIKMGAYDCLTKPLELDRVLAIAHNAMRLKKLKKENEELKKNQILGDRMIGSSLGIRRIRELVEQSAPSDSRVIILGENGTGKELVAHMIHNQSKRAAGSFVEVNCAAIPDSLIESELFGHEKGAFTGAIAKRRGKFEIADGGTLFLDEVADMSLEAQSKVLRALQEMSFQRVGGEDSVKVDVRIICATNKDIREAVDNKQFREDLYFRINVIPITVPSLRERIEDLPELINHFRKQLSQGRDKSLVFSKKAMDLLREYPWPGNIRQLKNYVERIVILVDEPEITEETANYFLEDLKVQSPMREKINYSDMKLGDAKDAFERNIILQRLKMNDLNVPRTAQSFGIYASNLHNKIKKLDIEIKK